MKNIIKIFGCSVIGATLITGLIGCACGKYKKEVALLKEDNWELNQKNAKLQNDIILLNKRCELLINELRQSSPEKTYKKLEIKTPARDTAGLENRLKSKGLEIVSRDGLLAVVISDLFKSGSISISADGKKKLTAIAKTLKAETANALLQIHGYTDDTPIKSSKYKSNEELSLARAEQVKSYLVQECGFVNKQVSTSGKGKKNPIADNKTPEGKKKNRRVEIVLP
jgi:chemotaxis protein MotB